MNKQKFNIHERIATILTILVCLDIFFIPWPVDLKLSQEFPSINLMGYTITLIEIVVSLYVLFGFYFILIKTFSTGKMILSPKGSRIHIIIFIILMVLSIVLGILNSNEGVLRDIRSFILPTILYLIFINLPLRDSFYNINIKIIVHFFMLISLLNLINFIFPWLYEYIPTIRGEVSYYNISATSFVLFTSLLSLIFGVRPYRNILISLIIFVSSLLYLVKASIFGIFFGFLAILLIGMKFTEVKFIKTVLIFIFMFICAALIFMSLPGTLQSSMLEWISYKFLNIDRNVVDISSGRFDIWGFYLRESLMGYGFSPYGIGHILEYTDPLGDTYMNKGTHNILVYLAYNVGLLSVPILLVIIFKFYGRLWEIVTQISNSRIMIRYSSEVIWTISILGINLGNLSIGDYRLAWLFWLMISDLVWLIKRVENKR